MTLRRNSNNVDRTIENQEADALLQQKATLEKTRQAFSWDIPEFYNIGVDISDRWAVQDPERTAIIDIKPTGTVTHSFDDLSKLSNKLANYLQSLGANGKIVGILLPQCVETAVCHIAVLKTGGISLPLFTLFGPEAVLHRLRDAQAFALLTNKAGMKMVEGLRPRLPNLEVVIPVDEKSGQKVGFPKAVLDQADEFDSVATRAEDPAILIYTSGTTGNPKGALHAHQTLLGHLPGVEMSHNFFPKPGDRIWTPADWAWIGGLLDVLMPALHHGVSVVARRFEKFEPRAAFDLIRQYEVKNAFLPPTALKMMRLERDAESFELRLRSIASGGETLGAELIEWGERVFKTTINEFYGQTECNMVVSSCSVLEPAEPGVMGFPVPGHDVAVIDPQTGKELPANEEGEIAVLSPDPVMMLEYLGKPEATREKFVQGPRGKWLKMGDKGVRLACGRIRFVGREDDVISSSGYRIGPAEIEDCLLTHEAVQMAGVVGTPDPLRGEIVTAFLVLNEGFEKSTDLAQQIALHVKEKLAAYEYPRLVHFIDEMPVTTTSKIIRADLRKMAKSLSEKAG